MELGMRSKIWVTNEEHVSDDKLQDENEIVTTRYPSTVRRGKGYHGKRASSMN
jgi:hypothetical protein